MPRSPQPLKPRKTPVQARSSYTVDTLHAACIQVLLDGGLTRLTTTRVAVRAGVSVGSLYQFFPNKESLLASVLERHLAQVVEAVEAACVQAQGRTAAAMAAAVVEAFVSAKFQHREVSRALYAVAAEVGGEAVVTRLTQRSRRALADMLATASDLQWADPAAVSFVLSTVVVGPVQALLAADAPAATVDDIRQHLTVMVTAYLLQAGQPVTGLPRLG